MTSWRRLVRLSVILTGGGVALPALVPAQEASHAHSARDAGSVAERTAHVETFTGAVAPDDERAIRDARARSNRAIAAHDTAAIAAEWMPDVSVVSSVNQHLAGRDENVRTLAQQFIDRPDVVYVREPDSLRIWTPWGMAAEYGAWHGSWTQRGEKIEIGGVYFAKWQKREDRWRIQAEIFVPTWCRGGVFCESRP